LDNLIHWFSPFDSAVVAFSSGVDSSVVAYAAHKALGQNAYSVTSLSPSIAQNEIQEARKIAREIGIRLLFVNQNDLKDQRYVANQTNRCYFCRNNLAKGILPIVKEKSIKVWVDGTQVDDLKNPRPGLKALREGGFRSPLVELSLGKEDVRSIARTIGLSNAERPSESCLSSRIAYGQSIDRVTLKMIERSEKFVKKATGCNIVRVRTLGKRAMIELDPSSIDRGVKNLAVISQKLRSYGYERVEIDSNGYKPGRMLELFVQENS